MAVSSKLMCSCYELGHTWEPSCVKATAGLAFTSYFESLKIYFPLYLVTTLLRRKKFHAKKLLHDTARSTFFLGTNVATFLASFCFFRFINGHFSFWTVGLLPAVSACTIALPCERKDRRALLALYVSNLAVETFYKVLLSRNLMVPVPYGEVLLFSVVSATYMLLYKSENGLNDSVCSAIRFVVGPAEQCRPLACSCDSSVTASTTVCPAAGGDCCPTGQTQQYVQQSHADRWHCRAKALFCRIIAALKKLHRHRLCQHPNSCCYDLIKVSMRCFGLGYGVQLSLRLLSSIRALMRRPKSIFRLLLHKHNLGFAAFLASFAAIFNGVNCMLRWARNKDCAHHGALAGFLAGCSLLFYRSSSLALYLASKLAEILYFKGIDAGYLPYVSYADVILYNLSCGLIAHVAAFEPHNLRPAYWNFLLKITGNRFSQINRRLLDPYGTQASRLFKDFKPVYDPRFSNLT